jgi:putative spermidine/putrescine transport system permease protein
VKFFVRCLGWLAIVIGLLPIAFTGWITLSNDSFLTVPTDRWSLKWYAALLADRRWLASIGQSMIVAISTGFFTVLFAIPVAWAIDDWSKVIRRTFLTIVFLPACLPPAMVGMGLMPAYHRLGLWGTTIGIVLAHTALAIPIVLMILRISSTRELRHTAIVARGLGANRLQTWRKVILPQWRPALFAAFACAFVLSINEALLTVFLSTPDNETLPTIAWAQLRFAPTPMVAVASWLTAILGTLGLFVAFKIRWDWTSESEP